MTEIELGKCMRALPRAKASPAFTFDVRRKMRAEAPRRPLVWRFAAAFAMTACLVAVVQLSLMQNERRKIDALRVEQQKIQAELAAVKKSASDTEPVVVLENDKGDRVIMDLDSAVQPASLKIYD
jgi:Tfp pilus assembly protein PilN